MMIQQYIIQNKHNSHPIYKMKTVCAVILLFAIFQVCPSSAELRSPRSLHDNVGIATKPLHDAIDALRRGLVKVVHDIEENPIYQNAKGSVTGRLSEGQELLLKTHDRVAACRRIMFEGLPNESHKHEEKIGV